MSVAEVQAREGLDGSGSAFAYRPHLDGLRAVAVYLVVLFHAGLKGFEGGFIGVDIFFVLSGYLVTGVLMRDLGSGGRVRFGRFYARRFRRLLPAAAVTLLATGFVWARVATPAEVDGVVGGFRAAFLYVANWYFIAETSGYFTSDVETNPVLHFWSLSIEEQFYFAWPLLLSGLFLVSRRVAGDPRRVVRTLVLALAAASVIWAWHLSGSSLTRAYYGTDARAYQLLAGAALALSPQLIEALRRRRGGRLTGVATVALIGVILLATSVVELGALARGVIATLLTVGLLVALEAGEGARGARSVLAARPMVALGRISYGTYLWHWPVIVVARYETSMSDAQLAVTSVVVGTSLAALSAWLLERRVRRSPWLDDRARLVVVGGLVTSLVGGLVIGPLLEGGASVRSGLGDEANGTALEVSWEDAFDDSAPRVPCPTTALADCRLRAGDGERIMVVGDSQTWSFTPAFEALAAERDWDLWTAVRGGCNWERGIAHSQPFVEDSEPGAVACLETTEQWYEEVIPAVDPDVVVLIRAERESPLTASRVRASDGSWYDWDSDEYWQTIEGAAATTVSELRSTGRKVVIVEPFPITRPGLTDPTQCLSGIHWVEDLEDCAYDNIQHDAPARLESIYRDLASADDGVWTLDLDPIVCPDGDKCPAVIDDVIVRRDWSHLTASFVDAHREEIVANLAEWGVVR